MKFLCDRCKTRYSIGDDRVRGKILKIRCKNCANVITVREGMTDADASAPPEAAQQPRRTAKPTTLAPPAQVSASPPANGIKPPAALEEEWYVSIDGEQSGPFSLHEAQRWVGAKAPTADLHCWSEGFDDWLPVDKVSHFRGLRKKATASVPIVRQPPPAPPPPPEEEPKPLFAATMAALERSAAAAAPATPLGGTPAHTAPMSARVTPLGGTPARSTPLGGSTALPKITNGSAPHAAITPKPIAVPAIPMAKNATGPRPALPLPAFDASDGGDVPTQIEVPPFSDEAATAGAKPARMPSGLPAPFAPAASPFAGAAPAPKPPAYPSAQPAPMFAQPQPAPMFPQAQPAPMFAQPAPKPAPEPEPEGDIEIGEVSRVVNLADLARSSAAAKARKNGAPQRLRTTGGVSSITGGDPIAAMVATPDASYAAQSAMVPEQSAVRTSNKKLYFLLGGVVLVLLIVVGAVVYVVSQNTDDDSTAIAHGREIDLSRPDDPQQQHTGVDKPDVKDPAVPVVPHPQLHRPNPNQNIGSGKTGSAVVVEEPPSSNSLKPEEVEAMARAQSEATNRCYMRAQRGADAILIGDVKRINVTLTIDREGSVTVVDLSDHATDTLGKCLQSRIKGWRFHPSTNGLTTRLTLVFQAS